MRTMGIEDDEEATNQRERATRAANPRPQRARTLSQRTTAKRRMAKAIAQMVPSARYRTTGATQVRSSATSVVVVGFAGPLPDILRPARARGEMRRRDCD